MLFCSEHERLNIPDRPSPVLVLDSGLRRNDDVHYFLDCVVIVRRLDMPVCFGHSSCNSSKRFSYARRYNR